MIIPRRRIRIRLFYDNSATPPFIFKPGIEGDSYEAMARYVSSAPSTVTAFFTVDIDGKEVAREEGHFSGSVPGANKFILWAKKCIKEHVV